MKKIDVYDLLDGVEEGTSLRVTWDRGNGRLEKVARFGGFANGDPLLYVGGPGTKTPLDIDGIGGYGAIISISTEYPDGAAVR